MSVTRLMARAIVFAAVLGWGGLGLQLYLIFQVRLDLGASLLGGVVNFFSYFTVLSNTLAAAALTAAGSPGHTAVARWFKRPWVAAGITVSIVLVGLAYNLLLRHLWQPEGLQRVADEILHDVMPVLFALYWWWAVPKGYLKVRHVLAWMVYPVAFFCYTLIRGSVIGTYPYPFLDVGELGFARVWMNAVGMLAAFVSLALLLVVVDRWRAQHPLSIDAAG